MDIQLALNKVYVQLFEHQSKMIKNTLLQDDGRLALANSPVSGFNGAKNLSVNSVNGSRPWMILENNRFCRWVWMTGMEFHGPKTLSENWSSVALSLSWQSNGSHPRFTWQSHAEPCDRCDCDATCATGIGGDSLSPSRSMSIHVDPTSKQHQCFLSSDQPEWFSEYSQKMKRDEVCLENFDEIHLKSKIDSSTLFKASWSAPLSFRFPWFLFLQIVRTTPMTAAGTMWFASSGNH